jgi:hypothetical protein
MKKIAVSMLTAVLITGFGSAAFASSCPKDMKAIDAALAEKPQLNAAQMSEVAKLRESGEAKHKSGDHAGSVADLHKAMQILGIGK